MNIIRKGLLLDQMEAVETAIDDFVVEGGLDLSVVKKPYGVSPGMEKGWTWSFMVKPGFSVIARLTWFPSEDSIDGITAVLLVESAMCECPKDPEILSAALNYNHGLQQFWRTAVIQNGLYLGTDALVDLDHVRRDYIPILVAQTLSSAGMLFNVLTTYFPDLEPLSVSILKRQKVSEDTNH